MRYLRENEVVLEEFHSSYVIWQIKRNDGINEVTMQEQNAKAAT